MSKFEDFVKFSLPPQKELNVAVVDFAKNIPTHLVELEKAGYRTVDSIWTLMDALRTPGSYALAVSEEEIRHVYEFLSQYSSGMIELRQEYESESRIIHPDYGSSSVVFLISNLILLKMQEAGMNVMRRAGMVFRN